MMLEKLKSILTDGTLDAEWENTLDSWDEGSDEEKEKVLSWIRAYRDQFMTIISDIDDDMDIELMVAYQYVELKSIWLMLNTQMNYQLMNGEIDPKVPYYGTFSSGLLSAIEPLLTPDDVARISEFIIMPIAYQTT